MDDQDPEVNFIISGSNEQVETLLERVRVSIEKAFSESPSMYFSLFVMIYIMYISNFNAISKALIIFCNANVQIKIKIKIMISTAKKYLIQ